MLTLVAVELGSMPYQIAEPVPLCAWNVTGDTVGNRRIPARRLLARVGLCRRLDSNQHSLAGRGF
jgi:predicted ABC-type transport system involved in lysophospholipase L1 biosynthesis ATPase subunit